MSSGRDPARPTSGSHEVTAWTDEGCAVCRGGWETGKPPPEIGVCVERHATLHRCESCGTLWEQFARYADVIDGQVACTFYPDALVSG